MGVHRTDFNQLFMIHTLNAPIVLHIKIRIKCAELGIFMPNQRPLFYTCLNAMFSTTQQKLYYYSRCQVGPSNHLVGTVFLASSLYTVQ